MFTSAPASPGIFVAAEVLRARARAGRGLRLTFAFLQWGPRPGIYVSLNEA